MHVDQFSQLILSESDICSLLLQGLDKHPAAIPVDFDIPSDPIANLPLLCKASPYTHCERQSIWKMPVQYKEMDIYQYIIDKASDHDIDRVATELILYQKYNAENLLKYCVYLVDTFRKNNILWGVGRGSSTASYVLFLIGIHRIDSLKYNLPLSDFFKNYDDN